MADLQRNELESLSGQPVVARRNVSVVYYADEESHEAIKRDDLQERIKSQNTRCCIALKLDTCAESHNLGQEKSSPAKLEGLGSLGTICGDVKRMLMSMLFLLSCLPSPGPRGPYIASWMQLNRLQLSPDTTEVLWCAPTAQVSAARRRDTDQPSSVSA